MKEMGRRKNNWPFPLCTEETALLVLGHGKGGQDAFTFSIDGSATFATV